MHLSSFSSILFRNTSSSSSSSSSKSSPPMQTSSSSSSSSPAGFKNITEVSSSPSSNLNHPSMINRFNFRSSSSSSSLMCGTSSNDHDESHHHNDNDEEEEEVVDEGELRFDREISIRDQRSGIRRNFPPPIPLLARTENLPCHMPWVLKRCYTQGRLVIKEVKVKHHEYFRALRSNGRLVLKIMHMDDANQLNLPHKCENPREDQHVVHDDENPREDQDVVDDENQGNIDAADHHEQDDEMKQDIDHEVNDDDALSLSLSLSSDEEEQFSADHHHHHDQHGLLRTSSSSSSFQPNPILEEEEEEEKEEEEEEEEKQDFHEVLRKKVRESMILASSMPEGSRVIGSCQPNNYKKSNLFRMPIASVWVVHT